MSIKINDPEILLQIAILCLLEDRGMTVHEVAALTKKTLADVWVGLIEEKRMITEESD